MKALLAVLAGLVVWAPCRASAAGFDEALRASGLAPLTKAARLEPRQRTPDWDGSYGGALWLREESFMYSEQGDCGGAAGCGRQVSSSWIARQQAAAASRALEETLLHRYGLRSVAREMIENRSDAPHLGLAAAAGAALLYADGLHVRAALSGVRLAMDVVPGRRLANDRELAKVELGAVGRPLSVTASFGRRAPTVGVGYLVRY